MRLGVPERCGGHLERGPQDVALHPGRLLQRDEAAAVRWEQRSEPIETAVGGIYGRENRHSHADKYREWQRASATPGFWPLAKHRVIQPTRGCVAHGPGDQQDVQ